MIVMRLEEIMHYFSFIQQDFFLHIRCNDQLLVIILIG